MTKQEAIDFITSLPEHARVHVVVQEAESLKAAEVMALLGISRPTLCHYVKRGLITIDSNYTGKQYRYNKDSVLALMKKS
jgi:DNA-directed RNA polymerase specialized sigma24 family protein